MAASTSRIQTPRKSTHRSTLSAQKTEVKINVYDLLPPGKLSSFLWTIGGSLLHSGVVLKDREYAYGGHDRPGVSGVYWTRPRLEPPGGTFRCEILHGFTFYTDEELEEVLKEASQKFQGTSYNLLTNNCNHFTSHLCMALTSRSAPSWLNRAASIGVALPCVVPKEWIAPPDADAVDGELIDEEEDERAAMLSSEQRRRQRERMLRESELESPDLDERGHWEDEEDGLGASSADASSGSKGKGRVKRENGMLKDSGGRPIPAGERAPLPR